MSIFISFPPGAKGNFLASFLSNRIEFCTETPSEVIHDNKGNIQCGHAPWPLQDFDNVWLIYPDNLKEIFWNFIYKNYKTLKEGHDTFAAQVDQMYMHALENRNMINGYQLTRYNRTVSYGLLAHDDYIKNLYKEINYMEPSSQLMENYYLYQLKQVSKPNKIDYTDPRHVAYFLFINENLDNLGPRQFSVDDLTPENSEQLLKNYIYV